MTPGFPIPDLSLSGVSATVIASGWDHTCIVVTGNYVKCWGNNLFGQLGIGDTNDRRSPVDVPGAVILIHI